MTRWSRWCRPLLMVLVIVLGDAVLRPQSAWAWHGRFHVGAWGGCGPVVGFGPRFWSRPWCGPFVGPPVIGPGCLGWGGFYGGTRFGFAESISIGGPFGGFFSGTIRSGVVVPGWYGPCWGGSPWGYTPLPFGCGWRIGPPIVVSPFPAAIAPQFGPAGVLPFMGFSGGPPARAVAAVPRQPLVVAQATAAARPAIAIRATNGDTRLRALRLVAVGDRHLRAAVEEPRKLAAALDAYRRAAVIAPDLPDTFLRQAIVLAALDRDSDAARSIERAVAIDPRLGRAAADAVAEAERLPPDPVFGAADPVDGTLASRTAGLLARIFATDGVRAAPVGANWIAARWSRALGGQPAAGDLDAVAAK